MTEKNERQADQSDKESKFTGSPEEQLPDLEGEGKKIPKDQQNEGETDTDTDKEE